MATKVAIEVDVKTGETNDDIIALREELEKVKQTQKEMGDQFKAGFEAAEKGAKQATNGVKGFGNGIKGLLKSLGIVALIVEAFNQLKLAFERNQEAADFFGTALTTVQIIMSKIINDAVIPLAKWLGTLFTDPQKALDSFIESTQGVYDVLVDLKDLVVSQLNVALDKFMINVNMVRATFAALTGDQEKAAELLADNARRQNEIAEEQAKSAEKASKIVDTVTGAVADAYDSVVETVSNAVEAGKRLNELEKQAEIGDALRAKRQLELQAEAERQRQIRDDISLSIQERIEANDKLGGILDKQIEIEKQASQSRLDFVNEQIKQFGLTNELRVQQIQAETELVDIEERVLGQRAEQLTNQKALEKELFDIRQELAKVEKSDRELELLELEQHYAALAEQARLAGDTETDIEGARQEALAKLRKKFRDEDLKKEKELRDEKVKLQESYLTATGGVLNSINQLVEASGNQSKEAVALQKTLAVAQIAIDTAKAIVGAIAQAQSVPYPANLVAIATGVAAVVAGIASAVSTLNSANVPGGSAATPTAPQVATAPAIQQATAGTTELGGAEQAQLAPIQAYVVETEVTGNQNNVNQIESQATFGG